MKIFIKAKSMAREEKVEKIDEENFVVDVHAPSVKGLANQAIVKAIAGYFGIAPSRVRMVAGFTSRQKILEIS